LEASFKGGQGSTSGCRTIREEEEEEAEEEEEDDDDDDYEEF
jgi:hypothetical protein